MNWTDTLRDDWEAAGEHLWKSVQDPVARNWESRFRATAGGEFQAERTALLKALRKRKALPDWAVIEQSIEAVLKARMGDWRAGFIPLFQGLFEEWADEWSVQLGIDFALTKPQVQEFVDGYAFQFVKRHQGVTADSVGKLVGLAHTEGWDTLQFMGRLGDQYDGWSVLRTEMIARSETIRSENAGSLAAYDAAGVKQVQWFTAEDDRVCPFCNKLHGKKWATGDPLFKEGDVFTVGDQRLKLNYEDVLFPPLHVFCRCTILPVM